MSVCRMKGPVLFYSSLYPGSWNPTHGLFVYELRRALGRMTDVPVVVPENGWRKMLTKRAPFAFTGEAESSVYREPFWTLPKIGKRWDADLMALCTRSTFARALEHRPWLVHAHYAYPEAAAAAELAGEGGLPLVVTVHGSDINVFAHCPVRGPRIAQTLQRADAVVTVSQALAEKVAELGVSPQNIFHPTAFRWTGSSLVMPHKPVHNLACPQRHRCCWLSDVWRV